MNTPVYVGVDNHVFFQSAVYLIFRTYIGSDSKEFTYIAGDSSSVPGPGRFPGEGNANPLQYSCLGNPIDRGAWWAPVHGVAESDMTKPLHFVSFLTSTP